MKSALIGAPLGVCVLPVPPVNQGRPVMYPEYIHEILGHAGLCYDNVDVERLPEALARLKILVTVGEYPLGEELKDRLRIWVSEGGAWIGIAGTCGLDDLFGVETELPAYSTWGGGLGSLGEGYAVRWGEPHPVLSHLKIALHYFNGAPVRPKNCKCLATACDAHQRWSDRAAVTESRCGSGFAMLVAPDLPGTVVHIQQGIAVTRDGISSPDGTAPVCDGVLKSGDGHVLDWVLDRQDVAGSPGFKAFLQPIADQWREVLLRAIFYLADQIGVRLPLLWLYPRNLPAVAILTHDSDGNDPAKARHLLEILREAQINSTWCILAPGYDRALIAEIRNDRHELAMHYDAMSQGRPWGEEQFDYQWKELVELFDGESPVSNKDHYLRWEGDVDLLKWCAARGIRIDQSKGAAKTGEAGYNFGTCHPYYCVDEEGMLIDCLEVQTPTQDLCVFAPESLLSPLLDAVLRHHGVLHLLFHPGHTSKPEVGRALLRAVKTAEAGGLEWWTSARLNAWERARRSIRWIACLDDEGGCRATVFSENELQAASFMWLVAESDKQTADTVDGSRIVERWGYRFRVVTLDVSGGGEVEVRAG